MNSKLTINPPSSNQYIPLTQIADFISELNNITFHENLSTKLNLSVFTSCTNISHINNTNTKKYFNHNQLINNNKYTKSYIDFFSNTTDDIFTNKNISNIYPINNKSFIIFIRNIMSSLSKVCLFIYLIFFFIIINNFTRLILCVRRSK